MKIIVCKSCGETKQHIGRGLCNKCYHREVMYPKHRDKILTCKKKYNHKNRNKISKRVRERYHDGNSGTIHMQFYKNGPQYWVYGNGKAQHRITAEKVLGRKLTSSECVHHIDGDGLNNAHNNLVICTQSFHTWMHKTGKF